MWRRLFRLGTRKWLVGGGSQPWAVLAVVSGGMLVWKRLTGHSEEVVHREVLTPGTTLIISAPTEPEAAPVGR